MTSDEPLVATPSQTVGPFFHLALSAEPREGMAAALQGERIRLRIAVTDGDGRAVDDALVEVWQRGTPADAAARGGAPARLAFGRLPTDKDGACDFETVRPAAHEDSGRLHAGHINVCFFSRGLLRQIHTRIYFAGDPALAGDPVLALVPAGRRDTLLARPDPQAAGRWLFHLRLQGSQETVFFDP